MLWSIFFVLFTLFSWGFTVVVLGAKAIQIYKEKRGV